MNILPTHTQVPRCAITACIVAVGDALNDYVVHGRSRAGGDYPDDEAMAVERLGGSIRMEDPIFSALTVMVRGMQISIPTVTESLRSKSRTYQ